MRGQAGIEYLFLVSVLLILLTPIFIYSTQTSAANIRTTQARDAVQSIAQAVEAVYKMGGGKLFVWITVPEGVVNSTIMNKTIKLTTAVDGGYGDVFEVLPAELNGTIPTRPGKYRIYVEMLPSNIIYIYGDDISAPIVLGTSPFGTISNTNPTLKAITNENAVCKYCSSTTCTVSTTYDNMTLFMDGNLTTHSAQAGQLVNGTYTYYVRCVDRTGNKMGSSAKIIFTVDTGVPDNEPPSVSNTAANATDVFINDRVCITVRVTDNNAVFNVWTRIVDPFGNAANYTMSDTVFNSTCASPANDDVYGYELIAAAVGNWTVNTTFATDGRNNLGFQFPYPNIKINVKTKPSITLGDIGLSNAWHFQTDDGIADSDATMKFWNEITADFKDSNSNTPPETDIIKRLTNNYEGYVLHINNESSIYAAVEIAVFTTSIAVNPYPLRVYAYTSLTNINASAFRDFVLTSANLNVWTNIDVTNLTKTENGKGWMRLRVTAQPSASNNKAAKFSEAKYRGG